MISTMLTIVKFEYAIGDLDCGTIIPWNIFKFGFIQVLYPGFPPMFWYSVSVYGIADLINLLLEANQE